MAMMHFPGVDRTCNENCERLHSESYHYKEKKYREKIQLASTFMERKGIVK